MDVIIERLEKESNLYKRVDLFFLVDSIIQCCRNQKGTRLVFLCSQHFSDTPFRFYRFLVYLPSFQATVIHLLGGVGDAYPSLIQAVLPRILYASAPPGNSAWENRRQCLKASFYFQCPN